MVWSLLEGCTELFTSPWSILTDDTSCPSLKADGSLEFRSCKWSNTAKMYQRLALSCSRSICLNDRDRCP